MHTDWRTELFFGWNLFSPKNHPRKILEKTKKKANERIDCELKIFEPFSFDGDGSKDAVNLTAVIGMAVWKMQKEK